MPTTSELVRAVHRDAATKQRLYNGAAPYVGSFAYDSAVTEMSAREFAAKCLKQLGLVGPDDETPPDPVTMLESWLAGKKRANDVAVGRAPLAGVAAQDGGDFLDAYLGGVA